MQQTGSLDRPEHSYLPRKFFLKEPLIFAALEANQITLL